MTHDLMAQGIIVRPLKNLGTARLHPHLDRNG